jgi:hypothetical protein
MSSSVMLRRVPLVRTDVSGEHIASIDRVTRMGELETTLAVTSKLRTNSRFLQDYHGVPAPEDGILHSHRRENLKSYIVTILASFLI